MSHCLFIHDFFQDGRLDVLAEVRILQHSGQWTCELRAAWTKEAKVAYEKARRNYPLGSSYNAGRIAGLKSTITANYPKPGKRPEQTACLMVYRPLSPNSDRFCGLFDCGDEALWGVSFRGDAQPFVLLCDVCRQEWERSETAYITPDGWDWHEHELLPLPVPQGEKLVMKVDRAEPAFIFFPCTTIVGLGMLDMALHVPIPAFLLQAVFVLHFMVNGKILQKFCQWLAGV